MIYRTEGQAITRIWHLAQSLGVWPGYCRAEGGWVLTYDPQAAGTRGDYEGRVLQ